MADTVGDVLSAQLREWREWDVNGDLDQVTFQQAESVVKAVLGGDDDDAGFIHEGVKQKAQQYLPGQKDED